MAKLGGETLQRAASLVASAGAINLGATEFAGQDLLVDTLQMSGDIYTAAIGAIAAGGLVVAYNVLLVDVLDDPLDG